MNVKILISHLKRKGKMIIELFRLWYCKKLCYVIEYKKEEKGAEGIEKKACDF